VTSIISHLAVEDVCFSILTSFVIVSRRNRNILCANQNEVGKVQISKIAAEKAQFIDNK
jgi:hypothetical protein